MVTVIAVHLHASDPSGWESLIRRPGGVALRELVRLRLPIAEIDGRLFALGTIIDGHPGPDGSMFAIGLDVDALRSVSGAIQGAPNRILDYRPQRAVAEVGEGAFSVFADGSLFGLVDIQQLRESETFIL